MNEYNKTETDSHAENKLGVTSKGRNGEGQDRGRGLKSTDYYIKTRIYCIVQEI